MTDVDSQEKRMHEWPLERGNNAWDDADASDDCRRETNSGVQNCGTLLQITPSSKNCSTQSDLKKLVDGCFDENSSLIANMHDLITMKIR